MTERERGKAERRRERRSRHALLPRGPLAQRIWSSGGGDSHNLSLLSIIRFALCWHSHHALLWQIWKDCQRRKGARACARHERSGQSETSNGLDEQTKLSLLRSLIISLFSPRVPPPSLRTSSVTKLCYVLYHHAHRAHERQAEQEESKGVKQKGGSTTPLVAMSHSRPAARRARRGRRDEWAHAKTPRHSSTPFHLP